LYSLDAASVKWLNNTTAVTDLSGNPWKCDCSDLGEAWRELKHKMTLKCSSPKHFRGCTWDVIDGLCPDRNTSVKSCVSDNPNLKTAVLIQNSATESKVAEDFPESDNQTTKALRISHSLLESDIQTNKALLINDTNGSPSQMTMITVIGVLSGCTLIAGGIILVVLVKRLRDSSGTPSTPQNNDVYAPGSSYEQVPTRSLTELDSKSDCATEHIYETVT
jgi:hypothetical protein